MLFLFHFIVVKILILKLAIDPLGQERSSMNLYEVLP